MNVSYQDLVESLLPAFKKLAQLQSQGGVMLHNVIADGINRNYRLLQQLLTPHQAREVEILKKHVISESKMAAISFKTVGQHPNIDFDYIKTVDHEKNGELTGREHQEAATKEMAEEKAKTVNWNPIKISEDEIAKVHNFPMDVYHQLSNFEIITTLEIPDKRILSMHKH